MGFMLKTLRTLRIFIFIYTLFLLVFQNDAFGQQVIQGVEVVEVIEENRRCSFDHLDILDILDHLVSVATPSSIALS